VVLLFLLALATFLVELNLEELHLLLGNSLVFFELQFQNLVFLFYFFANRFQFNNPLVLFDHVGVPLLVDCGDFLLKLVFQLITLILKLRLGLFRFGKVSSEIGF
jgi:hypothetical protein